MEQKENHTPQMETQSEAEQIAEVQAQLLSLSEIFGKTPYRLFGQYHRCRVGIQELSRIFGVLQSEEEAVRGGLSTYSAHVEREIAKCISECLSSSDEQMTDIRHILSLVKSYRVVRPLPGGKCSVSLLQTHLILQDNFQGSCLCKLFDIFLGCFPDVVEKSILF